MASWTPAEHEPALARPERRARGVYYTPAEIVQFIGRRTLAPLLQQHRANEPRPRIVDPACGAGAFLVEAARSLFHAPNHAHPVAATEARLAAVKQSIFGIDIDPSAVAQARTQLAREILGREAEPERIDPIAAELSSNVIQADALLGELPEAFANSSFHAVLGNPPYVNIRQLARQQGPDYVARLRQRFQTASGNFDLYIPFIERACELLVPAGRCALIVPNKIAGLGYAATCRLMLLEQTQLDYIVDLSASRVFSAAGVYPWIIAWQRGRPSATHKLHWQTATDVASLNTPSDPQSIDQSTLQADGFRRRAAATHAQETNCQPLGQLATIQCGTAGYMAQRIASLLHEATETNETINSASSTDEAPNRQADFIVSGNIDRYSIQPGNVRYLGQRFDRPQLSLTDPGLTARQRRLFAQPKLVLSGMTRRLEAAYDSVGLALGVQVYAVLPPAEDLYYLLGLLNSRWLSYWFREQFAAKQLSGGYLGINKAQLTQLPIRIVPAADRADVRRRRAIAEAAEALTWSTKRCSTVEIELDRRLDDLVYQLYRLTDAQIAACEAHFAAATPATKRRAA